jgi:hypothetical protein
VGSSFESTRQSLTDGYGDPPAIRVARSPPWREHPDARKQLNWRSMVARSGKFTNLVS